MSGDLAGRRGGPGDPHYVHGTGPAEQERLSRLNAMLNASSLAALKLRRGERVLDVGCGLGLLARRIAHRTGARVVGVERDERQLVEALSRARADGDEARVDLRRGDAAAPPLAPEEWGTFDVVHARFLLEHVTDPAAVVAAMVRAARPGGRIVLEDDDHDVLRLFPEPAGVVDVWRGYYRTYELNGKDPFVGRRLVSLLHGAGALPSANRCLFFGSCAGSPDFPDMSDNFIQVLAGSRDEIVGLGAASADAFDSALVAFREWRLRPDAALWYSTCWAEGIRPRT
jgi:SAM-dependent methyltransferase